MFRIDYDKKTITEIPDDGKPDSVNTFNNFYLAKDILLSHINAKIAGLYHQGLAVKNLKKPEEKNG